MCVLIVHTYIQVYRIDVVKTHQPTNQPFHYDANVCATFFHIKKLASLYLYVLENFIWNSVIVILKRWYFQFKVCEICLHYSSLSDSGTHWLSSALWEKLKTCLIIHLSALDLVDTCLGMDRLLLLSCV